MSFKNYRQTLELLLIFRSFFIEHIGICLSILDPIDATHHLAFEQK
jgi:hypothetical protein